MKKKGNADQAARHLLPDPGIEKKTIREILAQHRLAPSKLRGQNFLVQPGVSQRIVEKAEILPTETVVELGVGFGSLTVPLARRAARVIGLELDRGIVNYHEKAHDLPENVTLLHQDLLRADYHALARECGGRIVLVANLPYSVTNPLLFKLLEIRHLMDRAVLMVQKEVAERIAAPHSTRAYGILSVLIQLCCRLTLLMEVGPKNFHPRPKVDSTVVRLDFVQPPPLDDATFASLKTLTEKSFSQRRKKLSSRLAKCLGVDRSVIEQVLVAGDIRPDARPDQVDPQTFLKLARALQDFLS